ncbi:hypothetical protein PRZ48_010736 [Zasmidium cellare]|uniref:Major facilitator superfamily (MFS) profile domain-containing protein n=1 Tax=Zasmidium cellare TaxID=395010 RepID=A0ABR0E9G6_ZASCE|nr:hypothetical protein PRZ48_010736 [Zasmidium cellare]
MGSPLVYEKAVGASPGKAPAPDITPNPPGLPTIMTEKIDNNAIEHAHPAVDDTESINKAVAQGRDVDDAFRFAVDGSNVTWSEAEERKVRWKIDAVILPLLFISAVVGYSDSQAYGFAALFGLVTDLKLFAFKTVNGQAALDLSKYSLSASIANLGAVAGQYPLLAAAQYFSYGKFNCVFVIYTGLLSILTIVCKDFSDIMALRFFYGFATITQPLAIIITSMWWKTREQPLRVGLFIAGSALGQLVGQGVDLGATSLKGAYEASPWKWIYVILGSVTMGFGIIAFFIFPATPMTAWFLTPKEKVIAVRRLMTNNTGIQTRKFKLKQLREAALDPQLALLGIYAFAFAFANAALGAFGPFLITSFGYSKRHGIALLMPATAVAMVSMILSGALGSKFPRHRIPIAMLFILPAIVGNCILWKVERTNVPALLGGLYISTTFYGALVQQFSLLAANVAGHTKKSVTNATIVLLANLGGFSGPWSYHGDEAAQGYPTGQISALCLMCASEAAFAILWVYYYYQNKKKAALREAQPELTNDPNVSFIDLTDQENPVFNYVC